MSGEIAFPISYPAVLPLLAVLQSATGDPAVYHGRQHQLEVQLPRIEAEITVDGLLDERPWNAAALLTGFSQYMPVDGIPAEDSTEVLVWYAPEAVYFGIRAFASRGTPVATLADRDKIDNDDHVQLLLDTFNDRRRAFVFMVNPLGVQADGIRSEGSFGAAGGPRAGGPGGGGRFESVDLNPDFVFESKGRLTHFGYEVEVKIPFKSIRYQSAEKQDWSINIIRKVQHSGYEYTWTPARRANASFLAQSGTLLGLRGLQRGLVIDLNPFVTGKAIGTRATATPDWQYEHTPEAGFTARWGVTTNLTLDGTLNPDFSQVEADVGQVTVTERFPVFFPEKRPFFLEGIEVFDTPGQHIYMRRIVNPIAGIKLTGKISGTNVGFLSAVDDTSGSVAGREHPVYNLLRVRGDIGENSTIGVTYTDKLDGEDYNRLAAADLRYVFGGIYFAEFIVGGSSTRRSGVTSRAPTWEAAVDRTGRNWGFHYQITGLHPDFEAQTGFVPRTGIVDAFLANRLTAYGAQGARLENWTTFLVAGGTWNYEQFFHWEPPLETNVRANSFFTLRGGWRPSLTVAWETAEFDPEFYTDYAVELETQAATDTVAFSVPPRINDAFNVRAGIATPQFPTISARVGAAVGKTIAFFEPARANLISLDANVEWRPTEQIRISAQYARLQLTRERDGTRFSTADIPRLKIEYQLSRPIFLRLIGQYNAQERAALRDPQTDLPVLLRDEETGGFVRSTVQAQNDLRMDWLFSYKPNPGTVVFAGYGASLTEADSFTFRDLERVDDGFFVKLSYLFRL